jgi:hypothetical protein
MTLWNSLIYPVTRYFRRGRGDFISNNFPSIRNARICDLGGSRHFWDKLGLDLPLWETHTNGQATRRFHGPIRCRSRGAGEPHDDRIAPSSPGHPTARPWGVKAKAECSCGRTCDGRWRRTGVVMDGAFPPITRRRYQCVAGCDHPSTSPKINPGDKVQGIEVSSSEPKGQEMSYRPACRLIAHRCKWRQSS